MKASRRARGHGSTVSTAEEEIKPSSVFETIMARGWSCRASHRGLKTGGYRRQGGILEEGHKCVRESCNFLEGGGGGLLKGGAPGTASLRLEIARAWHSCGSTRNRVFPYTRALQVNIVQVQKAGAVSGSTRAVMLELWGVLAVR